MDIFESELLLNKISTVLIDTENLTIFLIYPSEHDSHTAYVSLLSIFKENSINIHFEFKLNFNFIRISEDSLSEPDSTVSITISDTNHPTEFALLRNIHIVNNISTWQRAKYIALNHTSNIEIDEVFKFVKLVPAHLQNGQIIVRHSPSSGEVFGFNSIDQITILPNPEVTVFIDTPPTMIGPK